MLFSIFRGKWGTPQFNGDNVGSMFISVPKFERWCIMPRIPQHSHVTLAYRCIFTIFFRIYYFVYHLPSTQFLFKFVFTRAFFLYA